MGTLKYRFPHPVKGKIRFYHPGEKSMTKALDIITNNEDEVEIPLDGISPGTWKIIIEWEYNKELYSLCRNIEVD